MDNQLEAKDAYVSYKGKESVLLNETSKFSLRSQ
jgi:hypothetical protein